MNIAQTIERKPNPNIPDMSPGDTVKVSSKIVEGDKERIQVFQGVVIRVKKGGAGANFTVRHVAYGVGVERTFPYYSPLIPKVEVVRHGKVRRARLYYLRGLSGKAARIKEKRLELRKAGIELAEAQEVPEEPAVPVSPEVAAETKAAPEATATQEAPASQAAPPAQEPAETQGKPAAQDSQK